MLIINVFCLALVIVIIILQPISPCNFGTTHAISNGEPLEEIFLIEATEGKITASLAINVDDVGVLYMATSGSIKVVSYN